MGKSTASSFDQVEIAINELRAAGELSKSLSVASEDFRPHHAEVRAMQRDIRKLEDEIKELTDSKRVLDASKIEGVDHEIEELTIEHDALAAEIPADWEDRLAGYRGLQKQESDAYKSYSRSATKAYEPVATVMSTLEANSAFEALRAPLMGMKDRIDSEEPEAMLEPLKFLTNDFNNIPGADRIKKGISGARRALKNRNPDREKAQAQLAKAISEYDGQVEWRKASETSIAPALGAYEDTLRETIGIRSQGKFTREQALFVAKCQSNHRDVSLNF